LISEVLNEQQILQCFINEPEFILKLDRNYFISQIGKDIFTVLKKLYEQEKHSIDPTVINIISAGNKINSDINEYYIEKLFKVEYDINNFDYYMQRLKEDFAKHNIENTILQNLLKEVSSRGDLQIDKIEFLVNEIEENLSYVKRDNKILYSLSDMYDRYKDVITRRQGGDWFYGTGDSFLDEALQIGFAPGLITTLFAATGIGKSVYALNLISRQINKQIPSLYISLEMDMISTMDRLIALRNRTPIDMFFPKALQENDIAFKILEKERALMHKIKRFYFVEEAGLSLSDLEFLIKDVKKKLRIDYLVVTVDLLTMLRDFNVGDDKQSTVYEHTMNRIHEMARELNVHILGVVQANRKADSMQVRDIDDLDKLKPSFNTIKNSGAIGERSRVVMSAFRAKYYAERLFPDDPQVEVMEDILEISILKQNMGKINNLKYLYRGDTANVYKYINKKE